MLRIVTGDIVSADTDYICHQVNCRNAMGSGVAKTLYTAHPEVKSEYHKLCSSAGAPSSLLGKIQIVPLQGTVQAVINIFGQLDYGYDKKAVYTKYDALKTAFKEINQQCAGKSLAFPYGFGCGLANGDWSIVERHMLCFLPDCDVVIYCKE